MMTGLNRRGALLLGLTAPLAAPGWTSAAPAGWRKLGARVAGPSRDLALPTADRGWIGDQAGKLSATRDRGETWSALADAPGPVATLGFVGSKDGFLGTSGREPLWRTADGGRSWSPVRVAGAPALAGVGVIDVARVKQLFGGESRTVHVLHAVGAAGGRAGMLRSVDDGANWSALDLSAAAGTVLDVRFLNAEIGIAAAVERGDPAAARGLVLRTIDGGRNWKTVYRSERPGEACLRVSFPSAVTGYVMAAGAGRAVLLKSATHGRSWKAMPLPPGIATPRSLDFADERTGWLGTAGGGFETRDGGRSWAAAGFGDGVGRVRVARTRGGFRALALSDGLYRLDGD